MLMIGRIAFESNLLLAPVARYTDLAFRLTVRPLGGLALACTDLINPDALLRRGSKTMDLIRTEPADRPLAIQLYGAHPRTMADAARFCADYGAAVVDINMGCPKHKICRRGAGAALLKTPAAAARVAEAMARAVPIPVTAKIRLGWSDDTNTAPAIARALESAGIAALTVHARTVDDRLDAPIRFDALARVVDAVRIPVIGNGDVRTPADAKAMIDRTGCDGIMIGRAALREPWIFRRTHAYLTTGRLPAPPTAAERIDRMNAHFEHLVRLRGERAAVLIFRRRANWYATRLTPSREFRDRVRHLASAAEYRALVDRLGTAEPHPVTP
jgi:tRNA-dihydrouridine synthase B